MFEIGASLAAARRAQGLELADAEKLTCIRSKHLAALEGERYEVLPGRTYSRAFLRTYANALGLDADRFVEEFELRYPEPEEPETPTQLPRRRRAIPVRLILTLAAVAAIVGFVAWRGDSNPTTPPKPPATIPPAQVVHVAPTKRVVTEAAKPPTPLVIRAVRGNCWLLVRRGSETGPVLYEATLRMGKSISFGAARVWIRFGAPSNVDARRGGHAVKGLTGGTGSPANLIA